MTASLLPRLRRLAAGPADADLLRRFVADRDDQAFALLMRRHGPMVHGIAVRVLGNRADAEDVYQATFLALARQAAGVRESLAGWLASVARRLALKARRPRPTEKLAEPPDPRPGPWAEVTTREALRILDEELQRLPEGQRLAVTLCCLEGLSQEEAARRLGWSGGEVRGRLERGRQRLRALLTRRGLTWSAALASASVVPAEVPAGPAAAIVAWATGGAIDAALRPRAVALALGLTQRGAARSLVAVLVIGLLTAGGALLWPAREPAAPMVKPAVDALGDPLPAGAVARMGSTRLRHAWLSTYVWLADGKTVLTAGNDRVLRYWDVATGKEKARTPLQGEGGRGGYNYLSRDGKLLAYWEEGSLHVWEVESGKRLKSLPGPERVPIFVELSSDGKTLAVGRDDRTMTFWDWRAEKQRGVRLATDRPGAVQADSTSQGGFSPDGKWLIAGAHWQEPLGVFEVATGREVYRLTCHARTWAVSPDNKTLVVSSILNDKGGTETVFRFYDLPTGKERRQVPLGNDHSYYSLRFSADGSKLACSGSEHGFILDCATGRSLARLPGYLSRVTFSPDGKTLVGLDTNRLHVLDAATGTVRLGHSDGFGYIPRIAVSPDGRLLAAGAWGDDAVRLWDTSTGRLVRQLPLKGEKQYIRDVAFLADGKTLVGCQGMGGVQFWEVATGTERRVLQLNDPPPGNQEHIFFYQLQVSADGGTLSTLERVLRPESTRAALWDLATGKLRRSETLAEAELRKGAWSLDGTTVALAAQNKDMVVRDVEAGTIRRRIPGGAAAAPVISPDGRLLAAVDASGTVRVYEAETGTRIATGPATKPAHLALAADGRCLVTCDRHSLNVWDLATGTVRLRRPLPGAVDALCLSLNGRRAFTVMADGTGLVWDIAAAAEPLAAAAGDKAFAAWWADLAAADAAKAYAALWRLAETPASIAFLRKHLTPATADEMKQVRGLIRDLDSDTFAVRESATKQLEARGGDVVTLLAEALANKPAAEARVRLERLLKLARSKDVSPAVLRTWRAIQAVEYAASPDARRLLADLAAGDPAAARTRLARAALRRR